MTTLSSPVHHAVVVIGGGQSGLAAGYHLARQGIDHVILEANDRVGDNWRARYDSLRLYSPAKYDGLPGLPMTLPGHAFPTGGQMGDYLEAYAAHHRLPVRTSSPVTRLGRAKAGSGFDIEVGGERLRADHVVVGSGPFMTPKVPGFASQLNPGIRHLHSADYRNPSQLQDGPVLVVGVSHSGADLALEAVSNGHRTFLSGRDHGQLPFSVDSRRGRMAWPIMKFVATRLLTLDTPIGRKMGPEVRRGGGPLLRVRRQDLARAGVERHESRTTGVADGRPALEDGTVLDVTNVIWCTGFGRDYGWIEFPVVGEDGWPAEERGVATAVPGLYFLGLPFQSGFASMVVLGAGADARHVVEHIMKSGAARTERLVAATG